MGDMEIVRQFNSELSTIYETKPPISKAKVSSVTRLAVKAIKYYKHVVQSIEKFAQKCRQEYKIPALYVMDSVIRQSRHQFGAEKDVYGPRFAKNITVTFQHIFRCSPEEQGKVIKVLNLWQKSGIYSPDVIQPLLNLPSTLSQGEIPSAMDQLQEPTEEIPVDQDAPNVNNQLATALEEQRQEHMQQIQLLQQQLQEQQRINAQQQQQLQQQHLIPGMPVMPGMQPEPQELQPAFEAAQQSQVPVDDAVVAAGEAQASSVPQPKFQLQPEVFAQIQALTGMNIRMPQANQAAAPDSSTGPPQTNIAEGINSDAMQPDKGPGPVNEIPGYPDGANFGAPPGMPVWGPHGMAPGATHPGPLQDERRSSVIDDFDYGDDDDDASRIAEQRRHLMEEERRLSQEAHPRMGELQRDFQNTFRQVGETPDRHPDPAGPFGRRSPDLHHRERSPGSHYHKPRSPRRRSRSPRWRDRSPRRRSRSPFGRERERDRDRDRDRDRGRNRDRERDWHKDRDSDRERGRGSDRESEKRNDGIPLPKKETLSVCSTTIWVGHLAKTVMKENLMEVFEANQLTVSSIDMVPPRGCAYVVMVNRHDASRVLVTLKNTRIHGNSLKLAWAAGKGVKGKEYKEYFDAEQGVAFIPWSKLGSGVDLQALGEGSWIDPETLPPGLQNSVVKEGSEAGSTDTSNTKDEKDLGTMSQEELMKLAAAQAGTEAKGPEQGTPSGLPLNPLGQPPQQIPPPGPHMFPGHHPMIPPPMMIQPPFPAAPLPPNMIPPGAPPPNMAGVPPPNVGGPPVHQFNPSAAPAVAAPSGPPGPPPNLGRPQERGQFPPDHNRFPSGMPQDTGQFPPQFPGRPQENSQFPPQDGNFPPGRKDEGGPFPPRRPSDEGQLPPQHPGDPFPPHHPVRPQGSGHFTPHHPGRPHDSGQFPPRHPGRFPDGPFPTMHHRPPTFHQRPPHHMRMPHFHPGGPRFPHDIPPLMPSGGPPRVPEFGPHPWGQGPGLMRGPPPHGGPPHGGPPHGRPDNKLPEEGAHHEAAEDWNEERTKDSKEGQQDEMNTGNKDNSVERPDGERDFPRGPRREFGERERDRSRERSWERGRDREDRGRDRDDRSRNREREDRFRGRDRGRDRERDRDRDRGRDRDWDRDDRRRDRDLNGDRDVPRDGPKRRSRFEPREENRVTESEVKENAVIETRRASCEVTSTIAQNSTNELASREEGEIVDGNENESGNIAMESETINISRDHEAKNIPIGNQAANFPQENETTNIPRNNEIMDTPAGDNLDITKDSEAVSFHQESNDLSSSRNFAEDTFKLPKQEIHEIEQASS